MVSGKFGIIISANILSAPFFLSGDYYCAYISTLMIFLRSLFIFLHVLFSFSFSDLKISFDPFSRSLVLSSVSSCCSAPLLNFSFGFSLVKSSLSVMSDSVIPWTAAHQATLSITKFRSLPKLWSIELVMPSNHLILCHPLFLLPPNPPSIRVFSNESALHIKWPKNWSFSFNISPSNEHPGLISFRMDWVDLLTVQGILKSLLQHYSSKASILQCSAFFISPSLTSIHDYWKKYSLD